MRHCKKNGLIFADPAARVRGPQRPETIILPLPASRVSAVTGAAATPAARLALALAAVHALRPEAIRHLTLGDIDLRSRRITLVGQSRPLDDLTRRLILEWLDHRRQRWPRTTSPYLLVTNTAPANTVGSESAVTAVKPGV
jgi:integrase